MKEPKYKLGDEVWVAYNNEARKFLVYGIIFFFKENKSHPKEEDELHYGFKYYHDNDPDVGVSRVDDLLWTKESKVFDTKEELLKSL